MKRNLFAELKRRNVFRAAVLYIGVVWALSQGAAQLLPVFDVPNWAVRWFIVAAIIGFPFWVALAWFFELTPEGLKLERELAPGESAAPRSGRKLDLWIVGVMVVAIVLLLTNTFVWHKGAGLDDGVAGAPAPEKSIAVLPFTNMSSDKEQEYFSDGIAEDVLNLLTQIPQLQVTARTSSFSFKGREVAIPEIARQLHVAHILEGSVRKAGNEVRVTAQLIDAAAGTRLWSQSWDRRLDDVFAIQDEIATDVVRQLEVTLRGAAPKSRQTDPKAYALFLQGRQLSYRNTADALKESDDLFHQVLAIDPHYVPAWIQLADNAMHETQLAMLPADEAFRRSREAAEKALAIDPESALAYAQLGWIESSEGDFAAAARHFTRALSIEPSNLVLRNSFVLLNNLGRVAEATEVLEFVAARDPIDVTVLYNLGLVYTFAGRFDDAIRQLRTVVRLSPDFGLAHVSIAQALLLKGDAAGALAEAQRETSENFRLTGLAMAYHALGRASDFDATMSGLIAKYEKEMPENIAYVYAFCGKADQAFEWLDRAVTYADPGISEILSQNLFDNIRNDPRWLPFLRKVNKAPEQLAGIEFKVALPQPAVRSSETAATSR